ncbi:MAG: hypothetical protein K0S32_3724 [Bacteroidetes bacterium]|jgi:hypothetical protein|nr:hypothetical protein [Bacteroidota bacterium]
MTYQQKQAIRKEEIFREEVRKELQKPEEKKSNKFISFFNTGFGLWFLTSVVVALFTFLYGEYDHSKKEIKERTTKINHLDLEIESRISEFWVRLEPLTVKDSSHALKPEVKPDTIRYLWDEFKNPALGVLKSGSIYEEYKERSTISLMIELASLLEEEYHVDFSSDKKLTNKDQEVRDLIRRIKKAATFIAGNGIYYESKNPSVHYIWDNFSDKIIIGRWADMFPYTDCELC